MKITIETDDSRLYEILTKLISSNESEKAGIKLQYKYDWSNVPDKIMWIATDSDYKNCTVWGYTLEPTNYTRFWDMESAGNYYKLDIKPHKGNWKDSLERRPKEFGG